MTMEETTLSMFSTLAASVIIYNAVWYLGALPDYSDQKDIAKNNLTRSPCMPMTSLRQLTDGGHRAVIVRHPWTEGSADLKGLMLEGFSWLRILRTVGAQKSDSLSLYVVTVPKQHAGALPLVSRIAYLRGLDNVVWRLNHISNVSIKRVLAEHIITSTACIGMIALKPMGIALWIPAFLGHMLL